MLFLLCFCFLSFSLATPKPWCEPSTLKSASKTIALAGGGIAATSTALGWWLSAQRDTAKKDGNEARYDALTRLMEGIRSLRNISFFTGVAGAAAYFYFDKDTTPQADNTSPSSDNGSTALTPAHNGSGATGAHTAPLTTVVLDDKTTDPKTYTYQRFEFDEASWRAKRKACEESQQQYSAKSEKKVTTISNWINENAEWGGGKPISITMWNTLAQEKFTDKNKKILQTNKAARELFINRFLIPKLQATAINEIFGRRSAYLHVLQCLEIHNIIPHDTMKSIYFYIVTKDNAAEDRKSPDLNIYPINVHIENTPSKKFSAEAFLEWYKKNLHTYAQFKAASNTHNRQHRALNAQFLETRKKHLLAEKDRTPSVHYRYPNAGRTFLLSSKDVHNSNDKFCTWHSIGLALTGQPFLGASFANWLGAGDPNLNIDGTDGNHPHKIGRTIVKKLGLIPFFTVLPQDTLSVLAKNDIPFGLQIMLDSENLAFINNQDTFLYDESYGLYLESKIGYCHSHMQVAERLNELGEYARDKVAINFKMLNDRLDVLPILLAEEAATEKPYYHQAMSNDIWMFLSMYILAKGSSAGLTLEAGETLQDFLARIENVTPVEEVYTAINRYRDIVAKHIMTKEDAHNLLLMRIHPSKKETQYSYHWLDIYKDRIASKLQNKISALENGGPATPKLRRRNSIAGLFTETPSADLSIN